MEYYFGYSRISTVKLVAFADSYPLGSLVSNILNQFTTVGPYCSISSYLG